MTTYSRVERIESADGNSVTERTYEVTKGFFTDKETLVSETTVQTSKEEPGMSGETKFYISCALAGATGGLLF